MVSYFFCQATDKRLNKATSVLRGLLYLLVEQQPSLIKHVQRRLDQGGKSVFEDTNAWITLNDIFTNILQDPTLRTTCLVIDALDECIEDCPKLLEFIRQNSAVSPRIKWMVSSRNWPEIEGILDVAEQKVRLSLELNTKSISMAVTAFIQYKVQQLVQFKKYDQKIETAVRAYLLQNSGDTFLWVALVCKNLMDFKTTTIRHAISKLSSFPPGLDPLYDRMMKQIQDSDDANLCKQTLAVAATVRRPLALQELMALKILQEVEDLESLREIIALCGSFLAIRNETVYFVHQSAKDFLLHNASNKVFPTGIGQIHHQIFSQSLDVLSQTLRRNICNLDAPGYLIDQVVVPDTSPLASIRYSCVYWVDHLYEAISTTSILSDDLQDEGTVYTFLQKKVPLLARGSQPLSKYVGWSHCRGKT
jgi:hypothetical protein